MNYRIETSKDAGQTYTVLIQSDDLEFLEEVGESLDKRGTRWILRDDEDNIVMYSFIHGGVVKLLESVD